MPKFNAWADSISGFKPTSEAVRNAKNVYPGDSYCRLHQAHAIWHEESANGLLDIVFLADYINHVLSKATYKFGKGPNL
mgnify:CR=1 FL=1